MGQSYRKGSLIQILLMVAALCAAAVSLILTVTLGDPIFAVVGGVSAGFVSALLVGFYPLDPRVWFATLGLLYSFAYSVLVVLGWDSGVLDSQAAAVSGLFFVSVLTSLWVLSASSSSVGMEYRWENDLTKGAIALFALPLVGVLAFYIVLDASLIVATGVESKRDLWEMDVGLPFSGFMAHVFLLSGAAWLLVSKTRARALWIAGGVSLVVVYVWLSTGERDVVFKWGLMAAFVWLIRGWVRTRWVIVVGALFFVGSPIMKDLGVMLGGGGVDFVRTQTLHFHVLNLEWSASGRNLETVLRDPALYENDRLQRFASDLLRGVLPGGWFSGLNTSSWYTVGYTPYVTGREMPGIGFSLVGALWIYAGLVGVVLGGLVFGAVSWWFYRLGRKGVVFTSAYLLYVPLALWSLRGDLSFWISAIVKQIAIPSILFILMLAFVVAIAGRSRPGTGRGIG